VQEVKMLLVPFFALRIEVKIPAMRSFMKNFAMTDCNEKPDPPAGG
jgi:hypothetical protein